MTLLMVILTLLLTLIWGSISGNCWMGRKVGNEKGQQSLKYQPQDGHGKVLLHMMWTTPAMSMQERHLRVLESYLYHHPDWHVRLYVTDDNWTAWRTILGEYLEGGYEVQVQLIDHAFLQSLAKGPCPMATGWIEQIDRWRHGAYFYSHLTDLLRFCLLFWQGGVYSDFDAVLLRPMDLLLRKHHILPSSMADAMNGRTLIGKDRVKESCDWCLAAGQHYLAPGVMAAQKGSLLLGEALRIAFASGTYDPSSFNAVGPKAVTMASRRVPRWATSILETPLFYPLSYWQAPQLFKCTPQLRLGDLISADPRDLLTHLRRTAVSLHFFGRQTREETIEPGSIMDLLLKETKLISTKGWQFSHPPFLATGWQREGEAEGDKKGNRLEGIRLLIPSNRARSLLSSTKRTRFRVEVSVKEGTLYHDAGLDGHDETFEEEEEEEEEQYLRVNRGDDEQYTNVNSPHIDQQPNTDDLYDSPSKVYTCKGRSIVSINLCLANLFYLEVPSPRQADTLLLRLFIDSSPSRSLAIAQVPIYPLAGLITVLVKTTTGRMSKVFELVSSLRKYYPRLPLLVADDSEEAQEREEGQMRDFYYIPLPLDIGLSAGRNRLVERAQSPLVFFLDDDFVFTADSDLSLLTHQILSLGMDLVAAKSPLDLTQHGLDYSGKMRVLRRPHHHHSYYYDDGDDDDDLDYFNELILYPGSYGPVHASSTCMRVDFVPNIFLTRTTLLRQHPFLRWDERFKVGEHEDFFLRARRARVRVATCPAVSLLHRQEPHWLNRTPYDRLRSRVWNYLKLAMLKHNIRLLRSFGMITMQIQELDSSVLSNLAIYELQPFSARFRWQTPINYHFYQIDVYDISMTEDDEDPGVFILSTLLEPSPKQPIVPSDVLVSGLDPDHYYRLVLRPGNHTHLAPNGPELILKTPDYHQTNLLENGDFEGDDRGWRRTLGALSGLVALRSASELSKKQNDNKNEDDEGAIPSRFSHSPSEANGRGWLAQDYAVSLYISAGPSEIPSCFGLYQRVPAEDLPQECGQYPCQIGVSAWTRVDRLYGAPALLQLQLRLQYHWRGGKVETFWEDWDPYEERRWQILAFSVGIDLRGDPCQLEAIVVIGWLCAPRGAVFFDDFHLSARPIINGHGLLA